MDFSKWLNLEENALSQRDAFFSLVKRMFPDAEVAPGDYALVSFAGRNLTLVWMAGTDYTKDTNPNSTEESYVKIDFFHQKSTDGYDFVGEIRKDGVTPESTSFARTMYQLVRGIKQLGIHIMFDADGMHRADSYASVLQKAGFTLGTYRGNRQMWLAHPVQGLNPQQNPYSGKWSPADLKRKRAVPATGGIQISL